MTDTLHVVKEIAAAVRTLTTGDVSKIARIIETALQVAHIMDLEGRSTDEIVKHIGRIRPHRAREIEKKVLGK